MNDVAELSLWIEVERPKWITRGVDVLCRAGVSVFPHVVPDGKVRSEGMVFVGTVEACETVFPRYEDFVPLIVLGEMSVEHAKALIEYAVEQVAGR